MLRSLAFLVLLAACDNSLDTTPRTDAAPMDAGSDMDTAPPVDAGTDAFVDPDVPSPPLDAGAEALDCTYASDSFGTGMLELDSGPTGSPLVFFVAAVPDPSLVESAELRFVSYDADHPGQEGVIDVNGNTFDLPAMEGWDNASGTGSIDVLSAIVAGDNRISFGPGPLDRSFFRIGDVELVLRARVDACVVVLPPPPDAVERRMHYTEATYSNRSTWVVPCRDANPLRNYAFTAAGDEHIETDCTGEFRPGGSRRGTAVFRFEDVVPARYRVVIRSRHTENRNPAGALFTVNGEERRILQTTSSDYEDDVWGERMLGGVVEVILDSTREANSDSVTEVSLLPI